MALDRHWREAKQISGYTDATSCEASTMVTRILEAEANSFNASSTDVHIPDKFSLQVNFIVIACRHAASIDMVLQCGLPVAFKTWAPYEWSYPYHKFILNEMNLHLKKRLDLAGLETIHIAHTMTELLREYVVGGPMKHGEASCNNALVCNTNAM